MSQEKTAVLSANEQRQFQSIGGGGKGARAVALANATRAVCAETTTTERTTERATTAKEQASLPTHVATVAGNMPNLLVSQTGSKRGGGATVATVVKDSNFRLNVEEFHFLMQSHPHAR